MHRTGLIKPILFFFVLAVGAALVLPQDLAAQELLREQDIYRDGDPTDPEDVIGTLEELAVDVDGHGIGANDGSVDFSDWLEQVFAVLRSLGLMAAAEPSP